MKDLNSPDKIAAEGQRIYNEKFRAEFEREHLGRFAVVDVVSERAFVGEHSEDAMQLAQKEEPLGIFYLMRIGAPAAFRASSGNCEANQ